MKTFMGWVIDRFAATSWAGLLVLTPMLPAAAGDSTYSWDGSCNNSNWFSLCVDAFELPDSNWDKLGEPTFSFDAVIGPSAPVVNINGQAECKSIVCENGLQIFGNSFLRVGSGGGFVAKAYLEANVGGGFEVTVPGVELNLQNNITWRVGTVKGPGKVVNLGTINPLIDPQAMTLNLTMGGQFKNDSGAAANFRFVSVPAGTSFENAAGAQLVLVNGPAPLSGGITSTGVVVNAGAWTCQHTGTNSQVIEPFFQQTSGEFIVQGTAGSPTAQGTYFTGATLWQGGTMSILDNVNMRLTSNSNPLPHVFDGLTSVSGNGNLFFQTGLGQDLQVISPLTINMTGTNGFVMASSTVSLGDTLTNSGKAAWQSGTLRSTACRSCSPTFDNQSQNFAITGGVALATNLENHGRVDMTQGPITFQSNGQIHNSGEFRFFRGNLQKNGSPTNIGVFNTGTFVKPNDATTLDSTISIPLHLEEGGLLRVEKANLIFNADALQLEGGNVEVQTPGVMKITGGLHRAAEGTDTLFSGNGLVSFEASTPTTGLRVENGATVTFNMLGFDPDGMHVGVGGRFGGDGLIENTGNAYFHASATLGVVNGRGATVGSYINHSVTNIVGGATVSSGAQLVNADDGTVMQLKSLTLSGPLALADNFGTWSVLLLAGAEEFLNGTQGTFTNHPEGSFVHEGVVLPTLPGVLTAKCIFNNLGTVHIKSGGRLNLNGVVVGVSEAGITQGTWILDPGSKLVFQDSFGIFKIAGRQTKIVGNAESLPNLNPAENEGELRCNGDWSCNSSLSNSGTFACDDGTFTCPNDLENDGGTCEFNEGSLCTIGGNLYNVDGGLNCHGGDIDVQGDIQNGDANAPAPLSAYTDYNPVFSIAGVDTVGGFTCTTFHNYGRLRPGGEDQPGGFPINGNLSLHDTGRLEIDVAGTAPVSGHDQVQVSGDVVLGGALRVKFLPAAAPMVGDQYVVLAAGEGSISGAFSAVGSDQGGSYQATIVGSDVVLTVVAPPVPGDVNGDGSVDGADLGLLLASWGPCECNEDLNGDGVVDGADLGLLLASWTG